MNNKKNKMSLTSAQVKEVQKAHDSSVEEILVSKKIPNLIGLGVGVKWKNGEPTGEPALLALVTQKVAKLKNSEMVPKILNKMQTDVLSIGFPMALKNGPPTIGVQSLKKKVRPAKGGYSVGHYKITAGTLGTCVYDILHGGTISPPSHGIGIPPKYYILSNNHVLANSNDERFGDPILQPGPYDGGTDPADRIATLSRFIPIDFNPNKALQNNLVDAAIAEGEFHDIDRSIYWIGHVRGWRLKEDIHVGDLVQKTGRTTSYTLGRITAISATVDVGYGGTKVARFKDPIITSSIFTGGDSGSLVQSLDNVAVGLLYAGSNYATILNYIEHVRSLLRVEVAEEIL